MNPLASTCLALALLATGSSAQWSDDFNRPNGPIGPDWTPLSGTWAVQNNRGFHTSSGINEFLQHNQAVAYYANVTAQLDVFAVSGVQSYYSGLAIGLGGSDAILVKIQDQNVSQALFGNIGIYHRDSSGVWGEWLGAGAGFAAFATPFSSARISVSFPTPDVVRVDIDTNFDGSPEETFTKAGVTTISSGFGMGHGIAAWNTVARFDNWNLAYQPATPVNDECANAAQLTVGTSVGSTLLANTSLASPCDPLGGDVWYRYTAPAWGGVLTLDTCGLPFDAALTVYEDCLGTLVTCDDDSAPCGGGAATVTFPVLPNRTYRVRVSDNGTPGNFTLRTSYAALPSCSGTTLSTLYSGTIGGAIGGQVFFDVDVLRPAGLTIFELDINSNEPPGTLYAVSVYAIPGTYVGAETNASGWTLVSSGGGVVSGVNVPSPTPVSAFTLAQGSWGLAIVTNSAGADCSPTSAAATQYANSDLVIRFGAALNFPWTGPVLTGRAFNGGLRYDCDLYPAPAPYCTAGTTTNGCTPSLAASANPSVLGTTICNLAATGVEGQKSGLIFYSISGPNVQPWNATSFLCVKAPTQRTSTQSSGGTANQCDGQLRLNWNVFQNSNLSALGQPWLAGDKVQLQAWFRDPPAGKATNLSNAIELTYVP